MKLKFNWVSGALLALVLADQDVKSQDAESPQSENPAPAPRIFFAPEDTDVPREVPDPFVAHAGIRSAVAERIPIGRGKEERTSFRVRVEVWEVEAKSLAHAHPN